MSALQDNRLADLERRLRAMEQQLRGIASSFASSIYETFIVVDRGNTLSDGSTLGVKFATVTTVPSLYNPAVTSSFIDGIGRGTLYVNGISVGLVLIVNDGRAGSLLNQALFATDQIRALVPVAIPLAGDPTQSVMAYPPYSL